MKDDQVFESIKRLSEEEHHLFEQEASGEVGEDARERRERLEVELDRCWDLLRQRRARRSAGLDPDAASTRDATTVENYLG